MWRAGCGADQVLELMDMFENKKIKIKKIFLLGGWRAGCGAGTDGHGRKQKNKNKKTLLLGGRRAGSGAGIDRYGRKD